MDQDAAQTVLATKIKAVLLADPHRAYTAGDLLKTLKLASPKDPEKEARSLEQIELSLTGYLNEGLIREVAPKRVKTRLFFDAEKNIEQAFIGGMGNTRYCFNVPVFRLNIGVLSLYFLKNEKAATWQVDVSDTTLGKEYSLVRRLSAGTHHFGTNPKGDEGGLWVIEGKYIDPTHVTVVLSGEKVEVEDHRTLRGTRINHLTDEGFSCYVEMAERFLKATPSSDQTDNIQRGRFVLEQLIHHHKNFEASFFNKVVDFVLMRGVLHEGEPMSPHA